MSNVEAHPQVYCDNFIYVDKWAEFAEMQGNAGRTVIFSGITADNEGSSICRSGTADSLPWSTAWTTFAEAVRARNDRTIMLRSATSYYLIPRDIDSP